MRRFPISPAAAWRSLRDNFGLIRTMATREIAGRYRESYAGVLWAVLTPLLMLGAYTFVFSVVFEVRWPGVGTSGKDFAIAVFAGMVVYTFFSECLNRAPGLVLANPNFVKKLVFPLEILPWVSIAVGLFHLAAGLAVWLIFFLVVQGSMHWTVVYFPLVLLPLVLGVAGLSWFLASMGVYLRDIGQAVGILTTVMLFLSPVFYPLSLLPEAYRALAYLNPLSFVIEQGRTVLMRGEAPDWLGLLAYCILGLLLSWLGFAWFQRTRRGFADVI
jgi:lipopolysaccharide transport system permease protein